MKIKLPFIKRKTYDRVVSELEKDLDAWEIRFNRKVNDLLDVEERFALKSGSLKLAIDRNKRIEFECRELRKQLEIRDKKIKDLENGASGMKAYIEESILVNEYENCWEILRGKFLDDSIRYNTKASEKNSYTIKEILEIVKKIEKHNIGDKNE